MLKKEKSQVLQPTCCWKKFQTTSESRAWQEKVHRHCLHTCDKYKMCGDRHEACTAGKLSFKPFPLSQILEAIILVRPKQDAKDKGWWYVVTVQKRSSVNFRMAKWCPSDRQCSLETLWVVINNRLHAGHYSLPLPTVSLINPSSTFASFARFVRSEQKMRCLVAPRHAMATNAALIWSI